HRRVARARCERTTVRGARGDEGRCRGSPARQRDPHEPRYSGTRPACRTAPPTRRPRRDRRGGGSALHDRGHLAVQPPALGTYGPLRLGRLARGGRRGGNGVSAPTSENRRDELAGRLAAVRERLDAAARAAGRDPSDVALLTVTKFFPASDAVLLHELGCERFGESREQEASAKIAEFRESVTAPVEWHMIGRVQRNKARAVVRWAHTVHSVDSLRLVQAFEKGVRAALDAGERTAPLRALL